MEWLNQVIRLMHVYVWMMKRIDGHSDKLSQGRWPRVDFWFIRAVQESRAMTQVAVN